MRRREFITLLGGAAATWPIATRAQQPAMPVIGFLRTDPLSETALIVTAFRDGLKEMGYVQGRNVAIELRSADNHPDRVPALLAELLARPVAVIVANSPAAKAAKTATATVPVIFTLTSDPVRDGLVASFNRPGGNVTGVAFYSGSMGTKRLELLRQVVPKAATIGFLVNPDTADMEIDRRNVPTAARAIGQQLVAIDIGSERDLEPAFATLVQRGASAVLVGGGPFMFSSRERLVALAARHALPASYALRDYVSAGGLMSYGNSMTEAYRQAGRYAGRILKGEKPADLPVVHADKFEFVINLKTAKALGVEFHPQLLATADEVIE
jgi:putative ABC transport system substrate-binding protein